MRPQCKRVVVVGGGLSGVGSVKDLKEENIEPVCYEKSESIGGTWKYREEDDPGLPSVMSTTVINHSKEFIYSNYLLPKEAPNYMRHFELYEHILKFCKDFDIMRHVVFNREVTYIKKAIDYDETGRWSVTSKDTITSEVKIEIFDGVLICVGHLCYPKMANFPGMETFSGEIMHTHSLKRMGKFRGKSVVVVGTGCSALDAAVEISSEARQVYLSIRTPSWIFSRLGPYGMPIDYALLRRYILFFQKVLPLKVFSWIAEHYFANLKFNHYLMGIEPKYPLLARDPIFSDGIAAKLITGAVVLRKNVDRFVNEGVIFDGENQVTKIDTVILATGYSWKFDFLEEGTLTREGEMFNLYKCMYPTHLTHPTLAIIGFVLPLGSGFPIGELQMRLAVHLLANKKSLPSEANMLRDAKNRYEANKKRYSPSEKMSIRVDFVPFCDELATELGAMPNFTKMAFTDPKLFMACVFGPCIPSQYRLEGPHKWEDAREAILTSSERMQTPLSAERLKNGEHRHSGIFGLRSILIPMMIACLLGWKNAPLYYYICAFIIPYYLISCKFVSKYFITLMLLPYFFNFHGYIALHVSLLFIFMYVNLGNIFVNRHFWT